MYEKKGIADMFCLSRTVMVFIRLSLYVYVRVRADANKKHEFVNLNGSVLGWVWAQSIETRGFVSPSLKGSPL